MGDFLAWYHTVSDDQMTVTLATSVATVLLGVITLIALRWQAKASRLAEQEASRTRRIEPRERARVQNLAKILLRPFGKEPRWVMLGLMIITAVFSMFMSNTATVSLILPVSVALVPGRLIAVRDPLGFRPLAVGRVDGAWVVASETCAFDLLGAEHVRDLERGEMVVVDVGGDGFPDIFLVDTELLLPIDG